MQVNVSKIYGPAEPGVYAVASVEVFDQSHSLVINGLAVLEHVTGRFGVWFPDPQEEPNYGGGSLFALNQELKQLIANAVLDAFDRWSASDEYGEPQWSQPAKSGLVLRR